MISRYIPECDLLNIGCQAGRCDIGQVQLILGTVSKCYVVASKYSKLCCTIALYKVLEHLDAIAPSDTILNVAK